MTKLVVQRQLALEMVDAMLYHMRLFSFKYFLPFNFVKISPLKFDFVVSRDHKPEKREDKASLFDLSLVFSSDYLRVDKHFVI